MRDILEDAEGAVERGEIGPGKANRGQDKPQFPIRFYKAVHIEEKDDRFLIKLDERDLKTPGRNSLVLPTEKMAKLVADEWSAIETEINPLKMPVTRLVNTAIDGVATEAQAVLEDVSKYAASDLLCYRADSPEGLMELQREKWDPVLDWAFETLGSGFEVTDGIMSVTQPRETISAFNVRLKAHIDPFRLTCIHTFTSLTGSAILALALAEGEIEPEACWDAAHVDEDWNISQWGEDYEAKERREQRKRDFDAACQLFATVA